MKSDLLQMLAFLGNVSAQNALAAPDIKTIKLKRFYTHVRTARPFLMIALCDPIDELCKSLSTDYLSEAYDKACTALEVSGINPSLFKYGGSGGYLYPHEIENDDSLDWFGWVSPEGHELGIQYHDNMELVGILNEKLSCISGPGLTSGVGFHHYYASNDTFSHTAGLFSLLEWILDDPRDVNRFPELPSDIWGGLLKSLAVDRSWMKHSPFALPKYGRPLVAALEEAILIRDI